MVWAERVLEALSAKGHRVTAPRRAILDQIASYVQPFSAEQLWQDLNETSIHGTIGRATIYRTVELLIDENWLARVHWSRSKETIADGDHSYVVVEPGHQHHLVCKNCGTVVAFQGCDIDHLLGGLARRLNFRVDGHWLEAYGLCQSCQRRGA